MQKPAKHALNSGWFGEIFVSIVGFEKKEGIGQVQGFGKTSVAFGLF